MKIRVECFAGNGAFPNPACFYIGEKRFEVTEVLDRWIGNDYRYYKVKVGTPAIYILRFDLSDDCWELVHFENHRNASNIQLPLD